MPAIDSLAKAVAAYATAFLLWLFSILVFLPAADEVAAMASVKPLVALAFLAAITVQACSATLNAIEFLNSLKTSGKVRLAAIELLLVVDSLLLLPPLYSISPILGGIGLILAVTAAIMMLLANVNVIVELTLELLGRRR